MTSPLALALALAASEEHDDRKGKMDDRIGREGQMRPLCHAPVAELEFNSDPNAINLCIGRSQRPPRRSRYPYSLPMPTIHTRIYNPVHLRSTAAMYPFPDDGISFAPPPASRSSARITIAHPYARLYAKKDGSKRRKIWNHVLEKQLFSPQELSDLHLHSCPITHSPSVLPWVHHTGAPYTSPPSKPTSTAFTINCSASAYIPFRSNASNPIVASTQRPQRYLVSASPLLLPIHLAQSMVAGLQHDATHLKLRLLELERSVRTPLPIRLVPH